MNIRELSIKEQKMIENAPFPYNKPELLAQYYRSLGKEPVIICLPNY